MDYKEKYEMALEGIQEILGSGEDSIKMSRLQLRLQGIFPELKESEDERIRKECISIIKEYERICIKEGDACEVAPLCIAWLEKQGEQKSIVEMKSPEESLGIDSDTYNKIVDECIYGEQKHAETEKGAKGNEREIPFSGQEWSEDDEQYVKDTLALLSFGCSIHTITQVQDWLKSLKNRVQPKQEWSEKDSRILYNVKAYIGYAAGQSGVKDELFKEANEWLNSLPIGFIYSKNYNEDMVTLLVSELKQIANDNNVPEQYQMEINWLKSLRPQKQWKPSEEQMKAIEHICDGNYNVDLDILDSIYRDFKKLREE